VQTLNRWLSGVVAAAVLAAVALTGAARNASAQESKWKDQAEFDISDAAGKDITAQNGAKALEDLNTWKQKYPDSFYKSDRESMYVQAYQITKQYDKVLDVAKELMAQNIDSLFPDPKDGPRRVLPVLVGATTVITQMPNPTPDQIATATQAANLLKDYNRKPADVPDAGWASARTGMVAAADGTLYALTVSPAIKAQTAKDYPAAEAAWTKALGAYPDKTVISYNLGIVLRSEKKDDAALYEFARTVAIDPTATNTQKADTITSFVTKYYTAYHGSPEGLDKLEESAKASPTAPADLHIKTAQEIAEAQQKEFETSHPDIALWLKLKATLTSDQGQQYFESSMKDAQVPELKGTVLESKCRAKELQVAIPLPDATGAPVPEITLKLETPLTGKAETGVITFAGVASAFTREPFMLTMTIEKKDIKDLKTTPCAPAPAGKKKK
jgi:tetratricopeptide (TPR) repeat protein